MTPDEVIQLAKTKNCKMLDLRFMDFPGKWQHTSYPISELNKDSLEEGFGFDGSSIRGWQAINESDMLLRPVLDTAFVDPFFKEPTLVLVCDIADPVTGEDYTRDPRSIAKKTEAYLKAIGLADTAFIGPEAEFFVFNNVQYSSDPQHSFFKIDSPEAIWNTDKPEEGGNLGHKNRFKEGYFPVPPNDTLMDIRTEM
ncbi:MAG: glutamine synthetase beta-grasp domain-containing protein, partial [Phycisphaeraceae bacterium]